MLGDISQHRRNFIFLFVIVLAACSKYEPVQPPKNIKVNPNPSEKFIVTVQIDDVVDIQDMEAIKRYQVSNDRICSPKDQSLAIGGTWRPIEKITRSKLNPLAHNTFQTIYIPKYYLDEPYYSMEICRWKGYGIGYYFTKNNVLYQFDIEESDIAQGNQVILQCESLWKNRSEGIAQNCRSHTKNEFAMISSYFVITINSKEYKK